MQVPSSSANTPVAESTVYKSDSEREKAKALAQDGTVQSAASRLVASGPFSTDLDPLLPPAQVQVVAAAGQAPATAVVTARDVNGDGQTDAVVQDQQTGASATLLGDGKGRVDPLAIAIDNPSAQDVDRLAANDEKTGKQFLAVDLNGDGVRQLAVKSGASWISLGQISDGQLGKPGATGVSEAQRRYDLLLGELEWLVPAFAWLDDQSGDGSGDAPGPGGHAAPRSAPVGFVQMLNGLVNPDPLKASDMNADNLGGLVMMDSFGGAVGAFDPFSIGMRLFAGPPSSEAAAPTPIAPPVGKGPG
jgi:hypothetical protein